jgi:hypothetical protein
MEKSVQDTGKFRKNTKDQYYTKASVAKHCVEQILCHVPTARTARWIEPSAGNGVFLKQVPATVQACGFDIDPKGAGIQKADFLTWEPQKQDEPIICFGNPPFGRQSSQAKAFLKHAATFAHVIAFILPRSFVKPSMSRAIPLRFHCVFTEALERNAFEVNGKEYDVPCVFQIWVKEEEDRVVAEPVKEEGFRYKKAGEPFTIAFKRVGGRAGQCALSTQGSPPFNPQFHYFLELDPLLLPHAKKIVDTVNQHTFPTNTVGPRSLSKSEANEVLNGVLAGLS